MTVYLNRCVVCGGGKFALVEKHNCQFLNDVQLCMYVACENCGLVFMNPMPTPDELNRYYSKVYWQTHKGDDATAVVKQKAVASSIISYIKLRVPGVMAKENISVLEIGSSFGVAINTIGETIRRHGVVPNLYAIEPSTHAIRAGAKNYSGVEVIGADVDALRNNEHVYDLIILSHVLEHFQDPVDALSLIATKLKNDGFLYIEVPNYYGHPSVTYAHSFCFTETSLKNTLCAAGLTVCSMDKLYRNNLIPLHLTCLARRGVSKNTRTSLELEKVQDVICNRKAGQKAYTVYLSAASRSKHAGFAFVWRYLPGTVKSILKLVAQKCLGAF